MNDLTAWSPASVSLEAFAPSGPPTAAVVQQAAQLVATAWRGAEVDPQRLSEAGSLMSGAEAPALRRWLGENSAHISLELQVRAGGEASPEAWLGLSCRGPTEALALAALAEAQEALGEALDVWSWWPKAEAPPPLPPMSLSLHAPDAAGAIGAGNSDAAPRWLEALLALSPVGRPARVRRVRLRSLAASTAVTRSLEAATREAAEQLGEPWELLDASGAAGFTRLRGLLEQASQAELHVSLHSERNPGAVLRQLLLHRLGEGLLGARLCLSEEDQAVRIDPGCLEWALQLLRVGAPPLGDDAEPPRSRPDELSMPPGMPVMFMHRR